MNHVKKSGPNQHSVPKYNTDKKNERSDGCSDGYDDKLVAVNFVEQPKKQCNKKLYLFRFSLARDKQAFSLTYLICQLFVDSEFSVAKHLKSHECLHQKLNEIQVRVDL